VADVKQDKIDVQPDAWRETFTQAWSSGG